jgi:hypothetical protein
MIRFDKLLFNVLFGISIPFFCFLVSWWGTFIITHDQNIIIIASFSGLGIGIIISLMIKLVSKPDIYGLSIPVLIMVYLFYNGVLFAMFMGIPFFHLFLGIIAGYYWAKYLINHKKITDYKREIRRISLFTSIVIGIVCMFSALVALINKSTIGDLKLMFNLPFDISRPMLIAFIVTGGILLIIVQYMLVKVTMKKTLQIN